ncbi:MAG: ABC transporter permease [Bacteroidetes bacterium]|nr:ABC transporter permease [Bacteroidota bacterium]
MLKNYLKIAFRNILRNKVYSFINIAGLAVGMAACITIFVYVQHEYSYDSFNKKADRIYRINERMNLNGKSIKVALSPATLGPFLLDEFPQIESMVRLDAFDLISSIGSPPLRYREKVLRASHFVLADSTFLDVFSFKMVQGNPESALDAPFSVVLTKEAAQKLFGGENPIGKSIIYDNKFHFTVTGIVEDPPSNSTIQFDYLGSLNSLPGISGSPNALRSGFQNNYYTYLLLRKGANVRQIEQRLQKTLQSYWDKRLQSMFAPTAYLEPLRDMYWDNSLQYDIPIKGSRSNAIAFPVIAIIVLLIACANFINLSTARSLGRAREIGIRKVVGGQRKQLLGQFIMESGLMSLIALLAAIALSELFIPSVNELLGLSLQIDYFHNPATALVILGIWAITGLLSGILPAFYLSSFQPVSTLKGNVNAMAGKGFGRQFFILFQFSAAIALIFCTVVVAEQYNLMGISKNVIKGIDKHKSQRRLQTGAA